MKKFLIIPCLICIALFISSCDDGDSGGTSGGSASVVSYTIFEGDDWVTCYNADSSVIMNPYQTCTWNCATYDEAVPRYWKLTFYWDKEEDTHSLEDVTYGVCQ